MTLKIVSFNYKAVKEKHQITFSDCQDNCIETKVACIPLIQTPFTYSSKAVLRLINKALLNELCSGIGTNVLIGTILERIQLRTAQGCPLSEYRITFEYDDSQLVDPSRVLEPCDITGFDCFNSSDEYLKTLIDCINAGGLVVNNTDSINLSLIGSTLSANANIAGTQAGVPNGLTLIAAQGLYVDVRPIMTNFTLCGQWV